MLEALIRVIPKNLGVAARYICLTLITITSLLVLAGCKVDPKSHEDISFTETKSAEQIIADYLSELYEQPKGGIWEEGKTYFLPRDPGIQLLQGIEPEAGLKDLRVYKANVWFIHWGPEKSHVLVWIDENEIKPRLGALTGPDEVASEIPIVLKNLRFKRPEARESLALLIGNMVNVFYGERLPVRLHVASGEDCEWVEQQGGARDMRRRIAASCFSEDGLLEKIVIARDVVEPSHSSGQR